VYTYLLLNIGTILFPFLLSFDKKVHYYTYWKALFPAIFIVGGIFIVWDILFTRAGVWGFNPDYLIGWSIFSLPIEEWLFFLTVPYACVFIYECLIAYVRWDWTAHVDRFLCIVGAILLLTVGVYHWRKWYTAVTFISLGTLLGTWALKGVPSYFSRFFQTYAIHLVPFAIINGVLTSLPVVIYNDSENLGIRLGTIPVEDTMYSMLLLLLNIHLYEYFKQRLGLTPEKYKQFSHI